MFDKIPKKHIAIFSFVAGIVYTLIAIAIIY